jgi:hypothetical protein
LEALRYAFYPQWNPIFTDADFYQCKVDNGIVIEVTLGDLTPEFCSDQKYGHHQRGWDKSTQKLTDESDDHLESVLTVRLTIGKELEPKWIASHPQSACRRERGHRQLGAELARRRRFGGH